jgi:hypothetical protein
MQAMNDTPSGIREETAAVIEVKLFETFLLYNRYNLYNTLCTYSLDNGPLEKENDDLATVSFRFMVRDWNNTLRDLLDRHNVPVIDERVARTERATVWHPA